MLFFPFFSIVPGWHMERPDCIRWSLARRLLTGTHYSTCEVHSLSFSLSIVHYDRALSRKCQSHVVQYVMCNDL